MGARGVRLRKTHQEDVRRKIQASQIINYLQKHALENTGSENANTRVRAAATLLNKVIPDVSQHEHSGVGGGPIELIHRCE